MPTPPVQTTLPTGASPTPPASANKGTGSSSDNTTTAIIIVVIVVAAVSVLAIGIAVVRIKKRGAAVGDDKRDIVANPVYERGQGDAQIFYEDESPQVDDRYVAVLEQQM
jgi:hypothetical protein